MTPGVWLGEGLRWYLTRAKHPLKPYIVGHYWRWFCKPRVWIRYDTRSTINVTLGDYLQQRIFFDGYYERPLVDWLKLTLKPDDVFWDVGANIGAITLVAARLCRRVVAFEPDPRSLDILRRNLLANDLGNVEVVPGALGVETGSTVLYQAPSVNTGMTSLMEGRSTSARETRVQVYRADDLIAQRPDIAPSVMKIDVEGAEHLVLAGARGLLGSGRLRAVVFEDARDGDARPSNVDAVARLHEARYRIEPFGASDAHTEDRMYNFLATPDAAA